METTIEEGFLTDGSSVYLVRVTAPGMFVAIDAVDYNGAERIKKALDAHAVAINAEVTK